MAFEDESVEGVEELGISSAKRGIIYVAGEALTSIIILFLLIFLARVLQPAAYGIYVIALSYNGILGIASNFGIGTAFRKMLPELKLTNKKEINEMLNNGYFIAFALGLIIAIVGYLVSNYIAVSVYNNPSMTLALQIAALAELFTVLFNMNQAALVGLGLVKEATIANTSYSVFHTAGAIALVMFGYGVAGAVAGLVIGLFLGTLVGVYYTVKKVGLVLSLPAKKPMKKLTSFSAPVVASHVATLGGQNLSVLLLGVYAAAAVVGNYGAAFKLARFVELTITAITFILLGTFSAALAKKETAERIGKIYNASIYYGALFLFPLIAYSIAVAQPMVNLLFSSQYAAAPLYFAIIIVGMALGIIGMYAGTLVVGQGDTRRFMKYQVGAVILQIVLLFIFTPLYQALGVMFSLYLVTPLVLNFVYMRALERQFKFKHSFDKLGKITLSSIIVGAIMFCITYVMNQSKWSLVVNAVVLLLLFPPLAAFSKGITKNNLDFIHNTGKRLKQLQVIVNALVKYTYIFAKE